MSRPGHKKQEDVARLKEELRKEVLQEIQADLKRDSEQEKANEWREEIKKENRGHWINIFYYVCALLFMPLGWYYFPNVEPEVAAVTGIIIGGGVLISFIILRDRGFTLRRLAQSITTKPLESTLFIVIFSAVFALLGFWVVSGRPARLVEESKQSFIKAHNGIEQTLVTGAFFEMESDGALGVHCLGATSCSSYLAWGKGTKDTPLLRDSVIEAGFDRIVVYIDDDVRGAPEARDPKRVEIKLK